MALNFSLGLNCFGLYILLPLISMGCLMFCVKSSGLSFLNSCHSVTMMQQSASFRQSMGEEAYVILFLRMDLVLGMASGEVINLGSGVETRVIDLAKIIVKLTGSKSGIEFHPLPVDDPRRRCPDTSKAEKLLRWKPKIGLEQGLSRTITWFQRKNA